MKRVLSIAVVLTMVLTSVLALIPVPAAAAENTFDASNYKETTEFTISTVADLEAFAQDTKNPGHDYLGKVVKLANDIEVNDITKDQWWKEITGVYTPVSVTSISGNNATVGEWGFSGTFDGQGHSIKGFIGKPDLASSQNTNGGYAGGLFKRLNGTAYGSACIKNLTIDGFYTSGDETKYRQGVIADEIINGAIIDNCTIKGAVVDVEKHAHPGCSAGMIAGYAYTNTWVASKLLDPLSSRTEFALQIINTKIDNTSKINFPNKKPSDELTSYVGGLVGLIWGETGYDIKVELSGSAINFEGVSELEPLGFLKDSSAAKIAVVANGVEKSRDIDLAKANADLKASGSYAVASNDSYTVPTHTHSWQEVAQEDATCRKTGVAAGKICTVCDTREGFEVLAKLQHVYGSNGRCTLCNTKDPSLTTEASTTPVTPDSGTTAGTTAGGNNTTPTTEAPASSGCGGFSGVGTIAAVAVAVVSVFGLALIVKKH